MTAHCDFWFLYHILILLLTYFCVVLALLGRAAREDKPVKENLSMFVVSWSTLQLFYFIIFYLFLLFHYLTERSIVIFRMFKTTFIDPQTDRMQHIWTVRVARRWGCLIMSGVNLWTSIWMVWLWPTANRQSMRFSADTALRHYCRKWWLCESVLWD